MTPLQIHIPLPEVIDMMRRACTIRVEREHPEAVGKNFHWKTVHDGIVLTEIVDQQANRSS